MKLESRYIFKSERLGFRNWSMDDLALFTELNADRDVMEHFPSPLTETETKDFIVRLQNHFDKYGYCYYAVEILDNKEFIGFIGMDYQQYKSDFTPATDIGWRLKKGAWGKGYATEGAKRCLEYAFNTLKIEHIISTCTINNSKSEKVMNKIGMVKKTEFEHPRLEDYPNLKRCILYEIDNSK